MKSSLKAYQDRVLKKPFFNILLIYTIISLLIISTGFYYYNFQKSRLVENRFAYLKSMAEFHSSQINEWLQEKYTDLQVVKMSLPLLRISRNDITSPADLSEDLLNWFASLKKNFGYENVVLFNRNAKYVYGLSAPQYFAAQSDSLLINNAIDSNKIMFSDSEEKTADQHFLRFYIPISGSTEPSRVNGVLLIAVDPSGSFESILNRNIDKSPTLETLLVKSIRDSVTYLNKLRFSNRRTESKTGDNNRALYKTSPLEGRRGFVTGIDYKNEPVIAYLQKIPSAAWFLITKLNQSEFNEPVNNIARLAVLVVISSDLILALILFFIWRKNIVANVRKIYSAEAEKIKLENRFQSLVNGVKNIGIILLDRDGGIISWNEGAEKIKGYPASEIIGKNASLFYTEEDRLNGKPGNLMKEAVKTGNAQDEGWRVRKDGSLFWANVVLTALLDDQQEVYGFIKITRDLTEKRNSEEEIKKSRDFYLKLLDDFPNPVWRSDSDGRCNYFNKAWLSFTGNSIERELGDGWVSGVHPEDRDELLKNYYESFRHKRGFTYEYRLLNSAGEYRWFVDFGMPYYDFNGKFAGFLGSCYDINDRIKYEETINTLLRISEKLYSSLEINQILDSLVTDSIQLVGAEKGFASIRSDGEFITKRYYNKDHWEYLEKKYSLNEHFINKLVRTKESVVDNELVKNGNYDFDVIEKYDVRQLLTTPLFGTEGELIGFFELHNKKDKNTFTPDDINLLRAVAKNASVAITKSMNYEKLRLTESQLRESEKELRNLAAQIQYARETERQHIAREVHDELGQLFTGINLNVSLLAELIELDRKPTAEEILNELHSVQDFVNKGIQAVRDISGSLRSYVLDHLGLIPAIQEYCREVERISNIQCVFESDFESIIIEDERNVALFRIIQEALTNVMRHADATIVKVKITGTQNDLQIAVSDNGKGISNPRESLSRSMGILGMKERAIFLGGKINIDSSEGKGTTVLLSIPTDKIFSENGSV